MLRRFTGKAAAAFSLLLIDALHITSPGADRTFPGMARQAGESAVTCRDTRLAAERLVGRGLLPPSVPLVLTVLSRLCPVNSWPPIHRLFPIIAISVTIKLPFWVHLKTTFYVVENLFITLTE